MVIGSVSPPVQSIVSEPLMTNRILCCPVKLIRLQSWRVDRVSWLISVVAISSPWTAADLTGCDAHLCLIRPPERCFLGNTHLYQLIHPPSNILPFIIGRALNISVFHVTSSFQQIGFAKDIARDST